MYSQKNIELSLKPAHLDEFQAETQNRLPLKHKPYCPDRISLFASPCVFIDGEPIHFKRRKTYALLAYLAVNRRSFSREYLATLLWPDTPEKNSSQNLRNLLTEVNITPAADILSVDRQMIGINTSIQIDVHQFEMWFQPLLNHTGSDSLLSVESVMQLEGAVQLYASGFLAGFHLKDSAEFDDWQYLNTQNYQNAVLIILATLANHYLLHSMTEQAYHTIHQWLAIDPLAEEAHQCLMQLYMKRNQPEQALHQYQTLVRLLRKQDDAEPLPETRLLYQGIRNGEFKSFAI